MNIKGVILGLKEFLSSESPLKMMKNAFYFTLRIQWRLIFGNVIRRSVLQLWVDYFLF